jgi:ParB-like chromosome segregation protein Spo0J
MMKPMTTRAVELWPVDRLKPHPDNPRSHPEEQIAQLAQSIETFGFTHPVQLRKPRKGSKKRWD